jgi:hypothetical protein
MDGAVNARRRTYASDQRAFDALQRKLERAAKVESRATVVCRQEGHPAHKSACQKWIDNGWTGHGCHCDGHQ